MAMYKHLNFLQQSNDAAFDTVYVPGATPAHSGIFRCTGCGREVVAEHTRTLPPQNHHQHTTQQGAIRWHMVVWADHNPK
jgi:hypothetical protein